MTTAVIAQEQDSPSARLLVISVETPHLDDPRRGRGWRGGVSILATREDAGNLIAGGAFDAIAADVALARAGYARSGDWCGRSGTTRWAYVTPAVESQEPGGAHEQAGQLVQAEGGADPAAGIPWGDRCTAEDPCPARQAGGGMSCDH